MLQKKAAICFSWQARTLDKCYEYIKLNILDQIWEQWKDYDIFCCTEDDKDAYKVDELLKPIINKKVKSSNIGKIIEEKYWELIKRNYKDFIYPGTPRFNLKTFLQQFYKNKIVNEVKNKYWLENNIKYLYTIRLRFDILPIDKLNFENLNNKNITIIYDSLKDKNEINDMFAIWNKENMDIYYSIFDNCTDILSNFKISVSLYKKIIFFIEKQYVFLYWSIIKILETLNFSKIIIDNLFKIFATIQWSILKDYKNKNIFYQEKMLLKTLNLNNIKIQKIKLNMFLVRENKYLNIFISKD